MTAESSELFKIDRCMKNNELLSLNKILNTNKATNKVNAMMNLLHLRSFQMNALDEWTDPEVAGLFVV